MVYFSLTIDVYSQQKQLAEGDFYASVNDATKKRFAASRRETRKDEDFTDGKLSSTTDIIDEYIDPDKQHFLSTETSNGKEKRLEVIAIGKKLLSKGK